MSIFKKVMASAFGVGAAKVDTIINTENIYPGQLIDARCIIKGGSVEQEINKVEFDICTQYSKEVKDGDGESKTVTSISTIQREYIDVDKVIQPGEEIDFNFSFTLGMNTPISIHKSSVFVWTNLDIDSGVDKTDRDYINVLMPNHISTTMTVLRNMGFELREVENEYSPRINNGLDFVQEFEFVATSGDFRGRLDELEVVFVPEYDRVHLYIQVDRKVRGLGSFLSEHLGLDESNVRISFEYDDFHNSVYIYNSLYELISNHQ